MPYTDKEDQAKCSQAHYERNREAVKNRTAQQRAKRNALVNSHKDRPCDDCGGMFPPCVYDFHHRDRTMKVDSVARLIRVGSEQSILDEIAKCDLLCANCHRIRHYQGD